MRWTCLLTLGAVLLPAGCASTDGADGDTDVALAASAHGAGAVTEVEVSMDDLPDAVAETLRAELGSHEAIEIEETSRDGVPIRYEAEYEVDGVEHEIVILPDGELVSHAPDDEEEEDDEPDDDDGEDDDD